MATELRLQRIDETKAPAAGHTLAVADGSIVHEHESTTETLALDPELDVLQVLRMCVARWPELFRVDSNSRTVFTVSQNVYDCLPLLLEEVVSEPSETDSLEEPDWYENCLELMTETWPLEYSSPFLVNDKPWGFCQGFAVPIDEECGSGLIKETIAGFGCIETESMTGAWEGSSIGYWSHQVLLSMDVCDEEETNIFIQPVAPISSWIDGFLDVRSIRYWSGTSRNEDNPMPGNEPLINAYIYALQRGDSSLEYPNLGVFVDPEVANAHTSKYAEHAPEFSSFILQVTIPQDKSMRQEALEHLNKLYPQLPITFPMPD